MRLRLTVAYDGSGFSGWQSQPDANAVQDHLERAFGVISNRRVVVHGAGRTDAGVHAVGQTAHADVEDSALSLLRWREALNANLPATIRIMQVRRAAQTFHARFSATGKLYRYTIWNAPVLPPQELARCWHVPQELDSEWLKQAAGLFVGQHDFGAFSASRGKVEASTVRDVYSVRVTSRGTRITLDFHGAGFLYKMVRMLSAAVIRCASGRDDIAELRQRLLSGAPRWTHVAPASGLCLVRVDYGNRRPSATA